MHIYTVDIRKARLLTSKTAITPTDSLEKVKI